MSATAPAHETGLRGEAAARQVARRRGWRITAQRLRVAGGEVDLYARRTRDGRTDGLVVEVKAAEGHFPPYDLVGARRQAHLWRLAGALSEHDQLDGVEVAVAFVRLDADRVQVRWMPLDPW